MAILAEGLGKSYHLARERRHASTLVEEIAQGAAGLARRLRGAGDDAAEPFWSLRDATFSIPRGQAVGLIGHNGSGKSTLLKILSRVTAPSEGRARLAGRVASLLEVGTGFHPDLTARQNIFLNGAILGMRRREIEARLDQIVEFAGVAPFLAEPVKHLSSGMYMRLAFAVAAHLDTEILLVDEVLAVGDAAFQEKCLGTMRDAASSGRTVLFVSHNMASVSQLTQRTIVLENGRVAFDGSTSEAVQHYLQRKLALDFQGRVPTATLVCRHRNRRDATLVIHELGLAPGQAAEIAPGGTLRMEFLVEATVAYESLRLAYTLNTLAGQPVLTGLSPPFSLKPGRWLLDLAIPAITVAPGDYDLSINLGTGGWGDAKLEHESFTGFGRVTVSDLMADGRVFGHWWSRWATAYHRGAELAARPPP